MAASTPTTLAAKRSTVTIPIVMVAAGDPVGSGIVDSLARPGENVSGSSGFAGLEMVPKRLELLKEAVSKVTRVAVLRNPASPPEVEI